MTRERFGRAKDLFLAVVELAPEQRGAWLLEQCPDDLELRRDVESLLAATAAGGEGLDRAVAEELAGALGEDAGDPGALPSGRRVGPYQIVREIGCGGMGRVYLALRADDAYTSQVALKVVKRGMDTEFIIERFRKERQILAGLEHPNIARLFDGGTTADGLPYLVMEYVEGEHLLDYCSQRELTTVARLELFRTLCSAVAYAHSHLVVHRDIKPGNILVTPGGVPKLLDFGVAKLLEPEALLTDGGDHTLTAAVNRILTPEYASPEQVRGERITTASDVYSLGVLLYELLTGRRPYRCHGRAPDEIARAVCEEEPQRPSSAVVNRAAEVSGGDGEATASPAPEPSRRRWDGHHDKLRRALRGDLDTIVMTALRKEPERRYPSVQAMSEDIRRHLEGHPVLARNDTFVYRSGKFIRRHRVGVAAAALLVATLLGGFVTTAWEARVARAERARAERRFNDVRALANSLLFEVHDAIKDLAGATPARQLLVKRALQYLDGLAREAGTDAGLQRELAEAYQRVGDVQGNPYYPNLGNTHGALVSYDKADRLLETLSSRSAVEPAVAAARVDLLRRIGITRFVGGDAPGAIAVYRRAVALAEESDKRYDRPDDQRRLAASLGDLGWAVQETGDTAAAVPLYRKAQQLLERLSANAPADDGLRRTLAAIYERAAGAQAAAGPMSAALELNRKAVDIRTQLVAHNSTSGVEAQQLAVSVAALGELQESAGDLTAALASYGRALAIDETLVTGDSRNAQASQRLATDLIHLGLALVAARQPARALQHLGRAVRISRELVAADAMNSADRAYLASALEGTGQARMALFHGADAGGVGHRAACAAFRRSQELFRALVSQGYSSTEITDRVARLDRELRPCEKQTRVTVHHLAP